MVTSESISEILGTFETSNWRRMEKIIWTKHIRNRSVSRSQEGKEYPMINKMEDCLVVKSYVGTVSKTLKLRKIETRIEVKERQGKDASS